MNKLKKICKYHITSVKGRNMEIRIIGTAFRYLLIVNFGIHNVWHASRLTVAILSVSYYYCVKYSMTNFIPIFSPIKFPQRKTNEVPHVIFLVFSFFTFWKHLFDYFNLELRVKFPHNIVFHYENS